MLTSGNLALKNISSNFPMTRTAVSKHLKILEEADLIGSKKSGRETVYQLSPEPLIQVEDWIKTYSEFWDKKLNHLKDFVENNDV
jgi:Predicted transcriptional regulators